MRQHRVIPNRRNNAAIALIGAAMFLFPTVAAAQSADDPSIVVEGNRKQQEEAARDLAKDVVGRLQFDGRCRAFSSRCASPWPGLSPMRSEEHTSELQSLMRISYAVFCLKK